MESSLDQIERLVALGRYLEARSLAEEEIDRNSNVRLEQLYGLALSKSGMPELAQSRLEKLFQQHPDDAETAGILGGIYKVLFKQTEDSNFALKSRDTYLKNFGITNDYYTGINAATMSMIAGQARKGREIAMQVVSNVSKSDGVWELATLGEAFLLSKEYQKATEYYLKARQLAGTDWGKTSSIYNQLWLIKHYMHVPGDLIKIFAPPAITAFVGHMIDHPQRSQPRFPESIQASVKAGIRAAINSHKIAIGYSSLACGGDILFAEVMEEIGGELNIFMPFNQKDFIEASVAFAGESWVNRFKAIIDKHPVTYLTQEPYENHADLFAMQSRVVLGATLMRSEMMHGEAFLLSVLSDYDLTRKEGGTRDNISLWPHRDKMINISPDSFLPGQVDALDKGEELAKVAVKVNRPTLYILVMDLQTDHAEELDKLFETVIKKIESELVPPVACCIKDKRLIAAFSSMSSLYDTIQMIRRLGKTDQKRLRLSVGSGPLFLSDFHEKDAIEYKSMEGNSLDRIINIHQYAMPGECIAVSPIAYELALHNINRVFVSRININDEIVEVFRLTSSK